MSANRTELSKFLSFVLRHKPDAIGLLLDPQGWASIDDLIAKGNATGTRFGRADLVDVVATSDKKRFSLSDDGQRIRAAQGHSVAVELGLSPQAPPDVLFHGTAMRFVDAIRSEGLKPQARQQVHLCVDEATAPACRPASRQTCDFRVDAGRMHQNGYKFFIADNGVWLTDHVPPEFLVLAASGA